MDPLAALIPWIAMCGALSLAVASFVERLIPVLPSYVLLVVVGIAAADGHFSLPMALGLTLLGSVLGCLPFYALGVAVGEHRSRRLFEWSVRLAGVSSTRFDRWVSRFRANEQSIALGAQMVPTVRLIAPGIAGLLRTNFWRFVGATTIGAALWNGVFISVGYAAALGTDDPNASALALKALAALMIAEVLFFTGWRLMWPRRAASLAVAGDREDHQRHAATDWLSFFTAWLRDPLRIAAPLPSSGALAELITSEIAGTSAPVIELGAGTGAFTRALLRRGVAEHDLVLFESDANFSQLLALRFPRATVLAVDATEAGHVDWHDMPRAGAAVSGLPLLSMSPRRVIAILEGTFHRLRPQGAFYQFTYGPRCPIGRPILDRLGLKAVRIGGTLANVPPASVYRITRRPQRKSQRRLPDQSRVCAGVRRHAQPGTSCGPSFGPA